MRVPAVVGSWPEPFVHGFDGERWRRRRRTAAALAAPAARSSQRSSSGGVDAGVRPERAGRRAAERGDPRSWSGPGSGSASDPRRPACSRRPRARAGCSRPSPARGPAVAHPARRARPSWRSTLGRGCGAGRGGATGRGAADLGGDRHGPGRGRGGRRARSATAARPLRGRGWTEARADRGAGADEARARLPPGPQPAPPGLARAGGRVPRRVRAGRVRLLEPAGAASPAASRSPRAESPRGRGGAVRRRAAARGCRWSLVMVAVNALVYHRGDTVLVRGWEVPVLGRMDVTLESLAAGAAIGLLVVVVGARLRRLLGLRRPRPGAAGAAAARPSLGADRGAGGPDGPARRGRPARVCARRRRCAGRRRRPVGRAALARRLVEGSLDRAVDVAATLELRGHSLPVRTPRASRGARATTGRCSSRRP